LEDVYIEYSKRPMPEGKLYLDETCVEADYICPRTHFQNSLVAFSCGDNQGEVELTMTANTLILITVVPAGVSDFVMRLDSELDVDLMLYDGTDNTGICIIGFNCLVSRAGEFNYEQMYRMYYSGDDRNTPVSETISIPQTNRRLAVYAHVYGADRNTGTGKITYSWSSIDPCPEDAEILGCSSCESYPGCKEPAEAVCDGSEIILCLSPEEAIIRRSFYDEREDDDNCKRDDTFYAPDPDCTPPTFSPTKSPSTDEPTQAPTTLDPTLQPTQSPTTSIPTQDPTKAPTTSIPTHDPTKAPTTSIPTQDPTLSPTTSIPTSDPTKAPTTSIPTNDPTVTPTFNPTQAPTMAPTKERKPIIPNPTCEEIISLNYALQADLEDLQRTCNEMQSGYQGLTETCNKDPSTEECLLCEEKEIYAGSVTPTFVDLDDSREVTFPYLIDTGYPKDTRFVTENNEVYIDRGYEVYDRTCVGFGYNLKDLCDDSNVVCAGGDNYGELEEIAKELQLTTEKRDGLHPDCPSGCRSLSPSFADYFNKLDSTFDTSRICIWSDEFYFIEDDGSHTFTCVGFGSEVDVCSTHKMVCVGFEEYTGLPTYGHPGAQARAVITSAGELSHVHPQCPGL